MLAAAGRTMVPAAKAVVGVRRSHVGCVVLAMLTTKPFTFGEAYCVT